jgi:lipopolysaccharide/colanic/teichoic acid biosynthesis glycosyltransferase
MLERVVAAALLAAALPALLMIGFVLRMNTDERILLADEWPKADGTKVRVHRFRTTGRGSAAFRALGRILRHGCFDDMPAIWDVMIGQITIREFYHLDRNR